MRTPSKTWLACATLLAAATAQAGTAYVTSEKDDALTLIDTATFWAAFMRLPEDAGLVNVDLKLNYLKSVVDGKAVIGFTQTTEIQMVKGAEVAGLMPDAHQLVSSYAMALTKDGEKSEAAKALYARINSAQGVEVFAHHGFEVKK